MKCIFTAFFSLFLLVSVSASPLKIDDPQDYAILDRFFRMMCERSEYGYVLDGTKPVSQMDVFPLDDLIAPQNTNFEVNACAREAIRVWNKISPQQSDYVLKATEIKDSTFIYPFYELTFINVPKLQAEIEANLNLFRYILGPTLDAKQLVKHILESDVPLSKVLKEDNVLTGIVLGFGAHNSLMHCRAEEIQNSLAANDTPPFIPNSSFMEENGVYQCDEIQHKVIFLALAGASTSELNEVSSLTPKLGFSTLDEELDAIMALSEKPSKTLATQMPRLIFGAYGDKGNQTIIADLEKSQEQTQNILARSDFLEHVLERITSEIPEITCNVSTPQLGFCENAEVEVAETVWNMCNQLDVDTVWEFVEAFCRCDPSEIKKGWSHAVPGSFDGLKMAKANLELADAWFATMPEKGNLKTIKPGLLYFEQTKVGEGKAVKGADQLLVSFVIEDGEGNVLTAHHNTWIQLSATIPGFAHGVHGMREGGARTLYIHPSLAYGALTTLAPCTSIIAKVTVQQVDVGSIAQLPKLEPLDLAWVKDREFYERISSAHIQLATSFGSRWGTWLKESDDLDFAKVCAYLKQYQKTKASPKEKECAQVSNQVFWNLITKVD